MDFLNEFILCFHSLSNEQTKLWFDDCFLIIQITPTKKWHSMKKETQWKQKEYSELQTYSETVYPITTPRGKKNCIWFSKMSGFLEYFRQSRYVYSRWTKKKLKCNATKLIFPHIYPSLKESRAHLLVTKSIAMMKKSSLAVCQILKQYHLIFSEV